MMSAITILRCILAGAGAGCVYIYMCSVGLRLARWFGLVWSSVEFICFILMADRCDWLWTR